MLSLDRAAAFFLGSLPCSLCCSDSRLKGAVCLLNSDFCKVNIKVSGLAYRRNQIQLTVLHSHLGCHRIQCAGASGSEFVCLDGIALCRDRIVVIITCNRIGHGIGSVRYICYKFLMVCRFVIEQHTVPVQSLVIGSPRHLCIILGTCQIGKAIALLACVLVGSCYLRIAFGNIACTEVKQIRAFLHAVIFLRRLAGAASAAVFLCQLRFGSRLKQRILAVPFCSVNLIACHFMAVKRTVVCRGKENLRLIGQYLALCQLCRHKSLGQKIA